MSHKFPTLFHINQHPFHTHIYSTMSMERMSRMLCVIFNL